MLPSYPYPSVNNIKKRSSIASERPSLHKYAVNSHEKLRTNLSFEYSNNNNNNNNNNQNFSNYNNDNISNFNNSIDCTLDNSNNNNNNNNNIYLSNNYDSINNNTGNGLNEENNSMNLSESFDSLLSYQSNYNSKYPLYGLDWSFSYENQEFAKIAVSSYKEDSSNKLEIIYGIPQNQNYDYDTSPTSVNYLNIENNPINNSDIDSYNFTKIFDYSLKYPITRLQWDPRMYLNSNQNELLATTSESLRIYEITQDINNNNLSNNLNQNQNQNFAPSSKLIEKAKLTNSKNTNLNQLPPMISFDWNKYDATNLITCSIDTTCTVWNLVKEKFVAKTQLIAHDSEVLDVKYICGGKNVFTSCSSDGSVRLFDLRNLEQSTIIYDSSEFSNSKNLASASASSSASNSTFPIISKPITPLIRLSTSNYNANQIAILESNSSKILILDLRNTSAPIYSLSHHSGPVNSIAWHPTKNMLLSGSDDCQVLIHDFSNDDSKSEHLDQPLKDKLPNYGIQCEMEVNNVCWSPDGSWVGINNGKQMQACKF